MITKLIQTARVSLLSLSALFIVGGISTGAVLAAPASTTVVASNLQSDACAGLSQVGGNCNDTTSLDSLFKTIVEILSYLVGVAAVIMVIVGGFKYITSGGDAAKVSNAKSTLIYALVGLVIAALAQVIVHFVLGKV